MKPVSKSNSFNSQQLHNVFWKEGSPQRTAAFYIIELECFRDLQTIFCNTLITKVIKQKIKNVKELDPGHKPIESLKIKRNSLMQKILRDFERYKNSYQRHFYLTRNIIMIILSTILI